MYFYVLQPISIYFNYISIYFILLQPTSTYFNPLSRHIDWNKGTTKTVITWITIPPNMGIAIGIIMSDPLPVDDKTGNSAITATAVVIIAGRTRFIPADTTASRTS
jgi:hypothetical protein